MPQVWRNNLAVDVKLPWGMVGTLEGIYSKNINDVVQYNANLKDSTTNFVGADNREKYIVNKINSSVSSAMVLTNTNQGYSYSVTAQLSKEFDNGFSGFVAYTHFGAKDMTSNPGSAAQSAWSSNPSVANQNYPGLSYSSFAIPSRIVGSITYSKEYAKHLKTSVSLFYQGSSQGRLDYIYSNDMNGDGNAADLMYIPKDASEIVFDAIPPKGDFKGFTSEDQSVAFWSYVDQDKYLSSHKGQYAERYGVIMPWLNRFDVKVLQDVFTKIGKDKHSLQISLDLLNVGNLLSSNWGIAQKQTLGSYDITLLKYTKAVAGVPHYTMNYTGTALPTSTYQPVLTTQSTWGAQVGIRYTF